MKVSSIQMNPCKAQETMLFFRSLMKRNTPNRDASDGEASYFLS